MAIIGTMLTMYLPPGRQQHSCGRTVRRGADIWQKGLALTYVQAPRFYVFYRTNDKSEPIGCPPKGSDNFDLVGTTGLEPVTSCMSSMHSNQLSYAPVPVKYIILADKYQ